MTVHVFRVFAALALLLGVLNAGLLLSRNVQDPIQGRLMTEALNSPLSQGESLLVAITREKVRGDCLVTSTRKFVNRDGQKVDETTVRKQEGGLPNARTVIWKYPTSATLPVGDYELRVFLEYHCPGGLLFTHEQEPVLFRVIAEEETP